MFYLSIETVNNICSISLAENYNIIDSLEETNPSKQAKSLFLMIESILRKNTLSYQDIGVVAVSIGPGSFTGVRIGIASVKGIAIACPNIKVIGVTSLEAIYANVYEQEKDAPIIVVLDASRNQVYSQQFDNKIIGEAKLIDIKDFEQFAGNNVRLIGSGSKYFTDTNFKIINYDAPDARMIMKAAWLKEQNILPCSEFLPFYMREPDAKIKYNPVQIIGKTEN